MGKLDRNWGYSRVDISKDGQNMISILVRF